MNDFFASMNKKEQQNFRRRFLRHMEAENEIVVMPCSAEWINHVFSTQGYYSGDYRHYYNQETKKFEVTSRW